MKRLPQSKSIENKKNKLVNMLDIQETLSKINNIPESTIKSDEKVKLKNLRETLEL